MCGIEKDRVIYVYDGTFDGLLCCVFEAFLSKCPPNDIVRRGFVEVGLFDKVVEIETDKVKAERVYAGIVKNISGDALYCAYVAFMAEIAVREMDIFEFLRLGFKYGGAVLGMMNHDAVLSVMKLKSKAFREAERLFGFVRFEELEGGIYYAELEPTHNVLELLAKHFEDRFPNQCFIICDKGRYLTAVYDTHELVITASVPDNLPPRSESENEYRRLWRGFYDAVGIAERRNPKLHRAMMPKKYWKYIIEKHPEKQV